MNPLRPAILAAAGSSKLKDVITRVPVTAAVVRRFVAGETRAELVPVAQALLASGRSVSVDFLGEYTTDRSQANAAVTEYLSLIDDLSEVDHAVPGLDTETPGWRSRSNSPRWVSRWVRTARPSRPRTCTSSAPRPSNARSG